MLYTYHQYHHHFNLNSLSLHKRSTQKKDQQQHAALVDERYIGRGDAHHLVVRLIGLRDPRLEHPPLFPAPLSDAFPWRLPVLRLSLSFRQGGESVVSVNFGV